MADVAGAEVLATMDTSIVRMRRGHLSPRMTSPMALEATEPCLGKTMNSPQRSASLTVMMVKLSDHWILEISNGPVLYYISTHVGSLLRSYSISKELFLKQRINY